MNIKAYEFQIAIRPIQNNDRLYRDKNNLLKFCFLKNPILRWLADPFLFEYEGKHYIFAESASRITGKGKLVYCEVNFDNLKKCKWKKCMKRKYHLSFPNISLKDGNISMIPETYQDNCIAKYVLEDRNNFSSWVKSAVIINNVSMVDTISLNDRFVSYDISADTYSLKFLSSEGQVLDQISDNDLSLRPAGKLFYEGDKTVLVSQKCKNLYGEGLIFNYLNIRDEKMKIEPFYSIDYQDLNILFKKKNYVGIHTYNFDSLLEIIDVRIEKFNIFGFFGKVFEKISKKHSSK